MFWGGIVKTTPAKISKKSPTGVSFYPRESIKVSLVMTPSLIRGVRKHTGQGQTPNVGFHNYHLPLGAKLANQIRPCSMKLGQYTQLRPKCRMPESACLPCRAETVKSNHVWTRIHVPQDSSLLHVKTICLCHTTMILLSQPHKLPQNYGLFWQE